jgi:oxygen-independent coproporphyrinogen-3 oxidase
VSTIYIGGGTQSILPPELVEKILLSIRTRFNVAPNAEITIECNPETVTEEKLRKYHEYGINRISFGVQSTNATELALLGRRHTKEQTENAVKLAKKAGFQNISCDIMLGIPKQTTDSLMRTIDDVLSLDIQHISAYMLKIEKNTLFYESFAENSELSAEMYELLVKKLDKCGFKQYEISNFALSNFYSRHNMKYWKCEEYLGFGASAHSFFCDKRFAVKPCINEYILSDTQKTEVTETNPASFEERAMLGLRLADGFDFSERKQALKKATELEKHGFLTLSGNTVKLTTKGFLVQNEIIRKLVF